MMVCQAPPTVGAVQPKTNPGSSGPVAPQAEATDTYAGSVEQPGEVDLKAMLALSKQKASQQICRPVEQIPANDYPDPRAAEIEAIVENPDPEERNREITASYHELSQELHEVIGEDSGANWATVAAWASSRAGQTIREDDFFGVPAAVAPLMSAFPPGPGQAISFVGGLIGGASAQTAQKVAEGNRTVYKELAPLFSEFIDRFKGVDQRTEESDAGMQEMSEKLADRPLLQAAFQNYYEAKFEDDPEKKRKLMLEANVFIGAHEQQRLDPYIDAAMPQRVRGAITDIMQMKLGDDRVDLSRGVPDRPGTGVDDWSDYDDRMLYIAALFERYHDDESLFEKPPV